MPTYRRADPEAEQLTADVIRDYYGEFIEHGVRVETLFAHADKDEHGEPKAPAIRSGGLAQPGRIRSTRKPTGRRGWRTAGICSTATSSPRGPTHAGGPSSNTTFQGFQAGHQQQGGG